MGLTEKTASLLGTSVPITVECVGTDLVMSATGDVFKRAWVGRVCGMLDE